MVISFFGLKIYLIFLGIFYLQTIKRIAKDKTCCKRDE